VTELSEAELGMLVEMAVRQIVEATRTATTEALAEISAHLEQGRTEAEAFLERTREGVGVGGPADGGGAGQRGGRRDPTEKKYEEAHRLSVERQEQLNQRADQLLARVLALAEDQLKRVASRADTLVGRGAGAREAHRVEAVGDGRGPVPGHGPDAHAPEARLDHEPRAAHGAPVGEAVIYTYPSATPAERAEMRWVNRWREPGRPDSTAAPEPAGR
jgi:hypothetical protein